MSQRRGTGALTTLTCGLVGYGLAGRLLHAPLIEAAGFKLGGVVTSRAADVATDFPDATVFASPEELYASAVDLVVIASPDHLHVAHAKAALAAGKHVVIDKPMAPTSAEALDLAADAQRRKLVLSVFHNRRWDNDFLTVRKLVEDGALGEVVHYATRWDRYRPNASGGWREQYMLGELYGLGSHLMDQALVLFGAPDWIFADIYKQRAAPGQGDGFEILMGKGKLRVSLAVNLLAADELRAYRVLGANAAFTKTGLDPQETQLRARLSVSDPAYGAEDTCSSGTLVEGSSRAEKRIASERGDWRAFYRGVHDAIADNKPPPVDPRDAARVISMLEAALESSRTGQRIDVPAWLTARKCA